MTQAQFKVVARWEGHKSWGILEWRRNYIMWLLGKARFAQFPEYFLKCALTFGRYDYIMYLA